MLLTWASRAAYYVGDDDAAFRFDSRAVSLARAAGALGDMLPPLQRLALSEVLLGHWLSAAAHAGEAARFARETGQPNMASLPLGWLALLAAYRGDTENLAAHLADAQEVLPLHPMVVSEDALHWARAVSEAAAGEPQRRHGAPASRRQPRRLPALVVGPGRDRGTGRPGRPRT